MFGLLRSALTGEPTDAPAGTDWQRLFQLLQQNHVAALASEAFSHLPQEQKPPRNVLIPWLSEREKAAAWYRHQLGVQQEIEALMQQHGIETLVLKGTRLARLYPQAELREFSDLDLYFYSRHHEADQLAAKHLGVQVNNDSHHHTKYDYRGLTVESHYDFVNRHTPPSNRRFEAQLKELATTHSQLPTFEILFLLRHMAGHFAASRITLRDLVDWHLLATAHRGDADWEHIATAAEEAGMLGFVEALNAIVSRHFGTDIPLPRSEGAALIERVEHDTVYGSLEEHREENLGRLLWKLRRYRANRWKHRLAYSHDPAWRLFTASLTAHAAKPRSILHKM